MKIVHAIQDLLPSRGGPAFAVRGYARALAARGQEVTICAMALSGGPAAGESEEEGVRYRLCPAETEGRWPRSRALAAALDEEVAQADILHLHSLYLYHDWAAAKAAWRSATPYIIRPHGTLDPYIRARGRIQKGLANLLFQRKVLRRAAALHFTAEEEARLAAPVAEGRPGLVVPIGIDVASYKTVPDPKSFHETFPATAGKRLVLFLSRLHEKKGLDLLLPAFAAAARSAPDLHLVIAGPDGGWRAKAERLSAELGIDERITFTGMLEGEVKRAAYAAAELFVLPSYSENFGNVVVEAMASGLPVLISDKVNIWREVEASGAGRVTRCDLPAVTKDLTELLDDRAALSAMAVQGPAAAGRLFSWDAVGGQMEEAFRQVLEGRL